MLSWPFPSRIVGGAPRKFRIVLYGLILAGTGAVATLGINLALLALETKPGGLDVIHQTSGGALVICGGGKLPEAVRDRFFELAGGRKAHIVVIPTAHQIADRPNNDLLVEPWRSRGAASVVVLHTRSREVANDPGFVRPLTEATGVWLGGGQQSWLTQAYLGTEVDRQFKLLLDRGGVIGGTSAGAAVMTRVMIAKGRTKADLTEGFDFFPGAVVDQHFLKRNRLRRLLGAVADHPELVGLGIDERTALIVNIRSRLLSVVGESYVVACIPNPKGDHAARLEILKPGDQTDISSLIDSTTEVASAIDFDAL
jgi:cyanophycinase